MPVYLMRFSYTPETWSRLIQNPEDRRDAASAYLEQVGGALRPPDIPEDAFADDVTCVSWWLDHGDGVGKGSTPEEARENLVSIEKPLQLIRTGGDRQPGLGRAPWRR